MIIVNLVFYDIMSVYFMSVYFIYYVQFCQRVRISTFMFLQGRSLNPCFERHSFMLLDNDNLYILQATGGV